MVMIYDGSAKKTMVLNFSGVKEHAPTIDPAMIPYR